MTFAVLAFDPGPSKSAYALVTGTSRARRVQCVEMGMISSDVETIERLFTRHDGTYVVAVEGPADYLHDRRLAQAVLKTRDKATLIATLAKVKKHPVVEMTCRAWRMGLIGKGVHGTPGDKLVKHAIGLYFDGLPKRTKTNVHVRDAMGLGCVVLWNGAGGAGR